jgi:hypothetical protein
MNYQSPITFFKTIKFQDLESRKNNSLADKYIFYQGNAPCSTDSSGKQIMSKSNANVGTCTVGMSYFAFENFPCALN